jgi:hypothetical protein
MTADNFDRIDEAKVFSCWAFHKFSLISRE